jgi:mannose-6-phosphate isomerase-like protein (cupin superfamily)
MIIKNFLETTGPTQSVHGGKGLAKNVRVFHNEDFVTPLKFINYLEMEPGSSIGIHRHGNNEEVYVILAGQGLMTVNNETQEVKEGDIIVNKPGWEHGLENTANELLKVFVFEVDCVK